MNEPAIRVATRSAASRRRAGRRFGPVAETVPVAQLDGEQLLAILRDQELLVERSADGADWMPVGWGEVDQLAEALGELASENLGEALGIMKEYQGGAGPSVDDGAAAAAAPDAGGEGGGVQVSPAAADTGATAPASAAGAASELRGDTTASTSSDSAAGESSEPEATPRPPVAEKKPRPRRKAKGA